MIDERVDARSDELRAALFAADLPVDDLLDERRNFFRFSESGATIGFGGFELHGEHALLRSLVILPPWRGKGLGQAAAEKLLRRAGNAGARNAYLLTNSAASFFEKAGFILIERYDAPAEILATRQATSLCPATAKLLTRPISAMP